MSNSIYLKAMAGPFADAAHEAHPDNEERNMDITSKTKVMDLISRYDFLLDFLIGYSSEFQKLKNPLLRNTVGRVATLETAAAMASVPLEKLLVDVQNVIRERTGESVEVQSGPPASVDPSRVKKLKEVILDLHAGKSVVEVKQRFAAAVRDVSPSEIAQMEQQIIAEGMPAEEIKRMCDVHVALLKEPLDKLQQADLPSGHPVHTFRAENRMLEAAAETLGHLLVGLNVQGSDLTARRSEVLAALDTLGQVEKHYLRKENQLFPFLEKHGINGPPQVMWSIHDDIRATFKEVRAALEAGDGARLVDRGSALIQTMRDMIYKEEQILFPLAFQTLDEAEWVEIRRGEAEIGYALITPGDAWNPQTLHPRAEVQNDLKQLPLDTGLLSLEQVNLMLKALPVDLSFVDENDEVRYYSESPARIFPRSPGVIGRTVQNCHPPKSVHLVTRILQEFRAGSKDVAEFWIQMGGRFLHIRYFPLRDAKGSYRGTLEVSQDVTGIRALQGEQRLLEWDDKK
jgi:uncharacterized protein